MQDAAARSMAAPAATAMMCFMFIFLLSICFHTAVRYVPSKTSLRSSLPQPKGCGPLPLSRCAAFPPSGSAEQASFLCARSRRRVTRPRAATVLPGHTPDGLLCEKRIIIFLIDCKTGCEGFFYVCVAGLGVGDAYHPFSWSVENEVACGVVGELLVLLSVDP